MEIPTAMKIVDDALKGSGQESTFDAKLKNLLILIVEASIRQGYVQGWRDFEKGNPAKVTREQLINFAELFRKAKQRKGG